MGQADGLTGCCSSWSRGACEGAPTYAVGPAGGAGAALRSARPALARAVTAVPESQGWTLEPKWDGWRCQIHTAGRRLWSRHGTNLSRQFSDVAAAAADLPDAVLDGELVAVLNDGSGVAFDRLQTRAGRRGPRRGADFTVHVAAFDVLAVGDADWRPRPYTERRTQLLRLLDGSPETLRPVPSTENVEQAFKWVGALAGVEGLVGKRTDAPYAADLASGWVKWRQRHTTEAVIIGVTGRTPATQALVLGRLKGGQMRAVGVSLPLTQEVRLAVAPLLHAAGGDMRELPGTVGGLPGADPVRFLPVMPEVVVEIEVDQARLEFGRYRHRPRVRHVRGDLMPEMLSEGH
ncbi:ATP-dependent DNA ligase [Streptomyces sp. TLI_185]|uniref:ATP-dependent DNA ligase n=1 Tax=Streptomyces sp. TLI_185 TaxID=2485151 RepID=UPI0021A4EB79|nr:ATP-dependent DNA ligase [Streptomyces sp. TLI_185]